MQEISLATIEQSAKKFSGRYDDLASVVMTLTAQLEAVKAAALPDIKKAVNRAAEAKAELDTLIDNSRQLFIKPKTLIMHGIKLGLRKGSGGIDWQDDDIVVSLIRKHFPKAQAELLIKTTEKPIAKALEDLDVSDLKRIGCTIEDTGDVIVSKPVAADVDRLVAALLKSTEQEAV